MSYKISNSWICGITQDMTLETWVKKGLFGPPTSIMVTVQQWLDGTAASNRAAKKAYEEHGVTSIRNEKHEALLKSYLIQDDEYKKSLTYGLPNLQPFHFVTL